MADKLPWFPLYASDMMTDRRFRNLSGDQMAAYLWLLMEQWVEGDIPFDVIRVLPGMPKGIAEAAVAYVVEEFFPPDPDTNRRKNPKLAQIADQQMVVLKSRRSGAAKTNKHKRLCAHRDGDRPADRGESQKQIERKKKGPMALSEALPATLRRLTGD